MVGYAECAATSEVLKTWADQGVQITKVCYCLCLCLRVTTSLLSSTLVQLDGAVSGSGLNTLIFGVTTPYAMVLVDGMVPSEGTSPASVVQAMQQSNLVSRQCRMCARDKTAGSADTLAWSAPHTINTERCWRASRG